MIGERLALGRWMSLYIDPLHVIGFVVASDSKKMVALRAASTL